MPRRKRTFIQRSSAHTFQLVHRPTADEPDRHVLLSNSGGVEHGYRPDGVEGGKDAVQDSNQFDEAYKSRDFELGEYGFPDDGYDYSQHFRTIGGGGGVFIDAYTGLPNPDAVVRSSSAAPAYPISKDASGSAVTLRDSTDALAPTDPDDQGKEAVWRTAEDVVMRDNAIQEIRNARRHHEDLGDVFAALDSDGELASTSDDDEDRETDQQGEESATTVSVLSETDVLEDDFIVKAEATDTEGGNKPHLESSDFKSDVRGILPKYREPRLLDAQFEEFMREYDREFSDSDEDVEELKLIAQRKSDKNDDEADTLLALLAENEKQGLGLDSDVDGEDLVSGFSGLQIDEDVEDNNSHSILDRESIESADKSDYRPRGAGPLDGFTNTEFESGMDGVLNSYTRVPMQEALHAEDGVEGARLALLRQETEERARLQELDELGIESDGHDSDLDTLFDELYKDKGEQWDCETILTTYSNLENHPSVIDAPVGRSRRPPQPRSVIRLDPRTQAPAEFMPVTPINDSSTMQGVDYGSRRNITSLHSGRPKDESKSAKKARKAAVKEAARERRMLKSEMKKAFGTETLKQDKHSAALGNAKVAVKF